MYSIVADPELKKHIKENCNGKLTLSDTRDYLNTLIDEYMAKNWTHHNTTHVTKNHALLTFKIVLLSVRTHLIKF